MTKKTPRPTHPWAQETDELLKSLETTEKGLSSNEAKKRLEEYGFNEIAKKDKKSGWIIFIEQLANPLVLVLVIASVPVARYTPLPSPPLLRASVVCKKRGVPL